MNKRSFNSNKKNLPIENPLESSSEYDVEEAYESCQRLDQDEEDGKDIDIL